MKLITDDEYQSSSGGGSVWQYLRRRVNLLRDFQIHDPAVLSPPVSTFGAACCVDGTLTLLITMKSCLPLQTLGLIRGAIFLSFLPSRGHYADWVTLRSSKPLI